MKAKGLIRRLVLFGCFLILSFSACQQSPGDGRLTITYPLETTELAGERSLRVSLSLAGNDGQAVEGATVQAELHAPNGDVFATLPCADKGQGRYLADYVQLPARGAEGTWRVVARATWGDDQQAQAERTFKGLPSLSEELQREYGFWLQTPSVPGCGYNSLQHRAERLSDGSGYVLTYNACHGRINVDVHWQPAAFPADETAAIAHAQELTAVAQHEEHYLLNLEPDLAAQRTTFHGQSASTGHCVWLVTGRSKTSHSKIRGGPVEWLIFDCPHSDWLWTIVISTSNESAYMDHLRTIRDTFECPPP